MQNILVLAYKRALNTLIILVRGGLKSFEIQWSPGEIADFTKKISNEKICKIIKLVYFTNTEKVFFVFIA